MIDPEQEPFEKRTPPVITDPRGKGSRFQWKILAHNKNVLKGWLSICARQPENAVRFYEQLATDPTQSIPGRCYALKGKDYQGVRAYEIGSGDRIYYTVNDAAKEVLIYYAGAHPNKAPSPPY